MRTAVITDIHSNLPALEAVLSEIDEMGIGRIWCLGDTVGYAAQPDECVRLVRERCEVCLVGNHDLAVTGDIDTGLFSASAAAAANWTRENADPETIEFLNGLEARAVTDEAGLYHASPRDPVWEYVLSGEQAAACLEAAERKVSLIGHSHVALFFSSRKGKDSSLRIDGGQGDPDRTLDLAGASWLLNPGSVGQPRDGNPDAAWLELDTGGRKATYRRVAYDIDATAKAIRDAGLPDMLAERLYSGQ